MFATNRLCNRFDKTQRCDTHYGQGQILCFHCGPIGLCFMLGKRGVQCYRDKRRNRRG
ncbi:MAG: hypothetical protein GXO89_15065, partial [Chlorobi bacterium]|nr:hypothetical protein [Chlorobiota bacterium]